MKQYLFLGGPWDGEYHAVEGLREVKVPFVNSIEWSYDNASSMAYSSTLRYETYVRMQFANFEKPGTRKFVFCPSGTLPHLAERMLTDFLFKQWFENYG